MKLTENVFSYPETKVGDNLFISRYSVVGLAEIGDDVLVSHHCSILSSGRHHGIARLDIPIREQVSDLSPTRIGRDVWIGAHSVVMNHVGEGSIIGAGSVVVLEIPAWSVAVGNPAKVIRRRTSAEPVAEARG